MPAKVEAFLDKVGWLKQPSVDLSSLTIGPSKSPAEVNLELVFYRFQGLSDWESKRRILQVVPFFTDLEFMSVSQPGRLLLRWLPLALRVVQRQIRLPSHLLPTLLIRTLNTLEYNTSLPRGDYQWCFKETQYSTWVASTGKCFLNFQVADANSDVKISTGSRVDVVKAYAVHGEMCFQRFRPRIPKAAERAPYHCHCHFCDT